MYSLFFLLTIVGLFLYYIVYEYVIYNLSEIDRYEKFSHYLLGSFDKDVDDVSIFTIIYFMIFPLLFPYSIGLFLINTISIEHYIGFSVLYSLYYLMIFVIFFICVRMFDFSDTPDSDNVLDEVILVLDTKFFILGFILSSLFCLLLYYLL